MHNQLFDFYLENNFINPNQYGFQRNSGTESACISLISKLQSCKIRKKHCSALFIDLRKAFDTVNHKLLLLKHIQLQV